MKLFILREEVPSAAAFSQVIGRDNSETLALVRAGEAPGVLGGDRIPLDPSESSDWSWSLPFQAPYLKKKSPFLFPSPSKFYILIINSNLMFQLKNTLHYL